MTTVRPSEAQGKQNRGRKSGSHPFLSQLVDTGFRGVVRMGFTLENVFWDALKRGREEITSFFFNALGGLGGWRSYGEFSQKH